MCKCTHENHLPLPGPQDAAPAAILAVQPSEPRHAAAATSRMSAGSQDKPTTVKPHASLACHLMDLSQGTQAIARSSCKAPSPSLQHSSSPDALQQQPSASTWLLVQGTQLEATGHRQNNEHLLDPAPRSRGLQSSKAPIYCSRAGGTGLQGGARGASQHREHSAAQPSAPSPARSHQGKSTRPGPQSHPSSTGKCFAHVV